MFNFMNMIGTYEQRKVDRTETDNYVVSTCKVTDSQQDYETAIQYNNWGNNFIVVEMYETIEKAREGHGKWVEVMKNPPERPEDVGTNEVNMLLKSLKDE